MPNASYAQTNFLGGEWSGYMSGRTDDPRYKIALARMLNAAPGEEGSFIRRSGFHFKAYTRRGRFARLMPWRFSTTAAYLGQFENHRLRFWNGGNMVTTNIVNVTAISAANPAVLTVSPAMDGSWVTNDSVLYAINNTDSLQYAPALSARQFQIVVVDSTHITLLDPVTAAPIDGSDFAGSFDGAVLYHILDVVTPYSFTDIPALRMVQSADLNTERGMPESRVTFLHEDWQPRSLTSIDSFSKGLIVEQFDDGPYMDPPAGIVSLTPNDTDGLITLTLATGAPTWLIGTTYDKGDIVFTVHDGTVGQFWISLHGSNTGNAPGGVGGGDQMTDHWAALPLTWSAGVSYDVGAAVIYGSSTDELQIYYSRAAANLNSAPPDFPLLWSTMPPLFDAAVTYAGGPVWVTFDGAYWVGTAGNTSVGTEPPDDTASWFSGLTPQLVFSLFPNINNGQGFLPSDAGRCIRLRSGPAPWDKATAYAINDMVEFIGNSYKALTTSTGVQPDLDAAKWEIQSVGPEWTWGRIAFAAQDATGDVPQWAAGTYAAGDMVAWGPGVSQGETPTIAFVSLNSGNISEPPNDGITMSSNGWVQVGTFVDWSVLPNVATPPWIANGEYDFGDIISLDASAYVSTVDNPTETPGVGDEWLLVTGTPGTVEFLGEPRMVWVMIEGNPLPNTGPIYLWRLGLYSDTTGWPRCGAYHEGRLWLSGPAKNRFDGSVSNDPFNFSPTGPDGTVADNNSISYTANFEDQNDIFWFAPNPGGLVAGTLAGELLISASSFDDPLTPSSIQIRRVTKYGCANFEPEKLPSALAVIQARRRKILEYAGADQKFAAVNLTQAAKHLTEGGVIDIAFQTERLPILWAKTAPQALFGLSYKKDPEQQYVAAHDTEHGAEKRFVSIAVMVSPDGTEENLWVIVRDSDNVYSVEMLESVFEEEDDLPDAFFVDGLRPNGAVWVDEGGDNGSMKFFGLWPLRTQSMAAFLAADLGDFTVDTDGTMTIPFSDTFTVQMILDNLTVEPDTLAAPEPDRFVVDFTGAPFVADLPPITEGNHYELPAAMGYTYNSDGQQLEPVEGAANGPAFGKTRRNHKHALKLLRVHEVQVGLNFDEMEQVSLREDDDSTPIGQTALFSGTVRDLLDSSYDFEGQIAWRFSRPLPGVVLVVSGFLATQDV